MEHHCFYGGRVMTLDGRINQIKRQINERTQHPFLDRFIEKPDIDEDKIRILALMFEENGEYGDALQCITAVMLMQMALDMHDFVDNADFSQPLRQRQLSVLAGDYYSSQYYCLLSEAGAFSMIRSLARGIRLLNEEKVRLVQGTWQWPQFIHLIEKIEASLITALADFLHLSDWVPFIQSYFAYKRILKEKNTWQSGRPSSFLRPLFHADMVKKSEFLARCDEFLLVLKERLEALMRQASGNHHIFHAFDPIWKAQDEVAPNSLAGEGF